jgi:putative ABC transport system permease protein
MLEMFRVRIRALLRKNQAERDLDEELRYHLEKEIERNVARGMTAEEARRTALRGFGGIQQIKEESRDARGVRLLEEILRDVRYAARVIVQEPGFTAVAVLMLALGTGANTAIFTLVDELLIRPLQVDHAEELVKVEAESLNPHFMNTIFSHPDYFDYRELNQVMSGLIAYAERDGVLGSSDSPLKVSINLVSANYFDVLGVRVRGRGFLPEEENPGASPAVTVIGYGLWRRLGSDPDIIGKTVIVNGMSLTVVGLGPKGFTGLRLERSTDLWVPLTMFRPLMGINGDPLPVRRMAWLQVMGRLRPGINLAAARDGLDATARQVFEANTAPADRQLPFNEKRILLEPGGKGASILRTELGPALRLLMAIVALLLIISCANIASLMLARAVAKQKETAVRLALGAGRARVVRLLLTQSLMLTMIGAAAGMALAPWLRGIVLAFKPGLNLMDTSLSSGLDGRILAFTLGVSIACGLLFGLAPALQTRKVDIAAELKGSLSSPGSRIRRFDVRSALVIGQIALAVLVLVAAGLLVRSLQNLLAVDLGFSPDKILVLPLELPREKYAKDASQFYRVLESRLAALPGVEVVSTASITPMSGSVGSMGILIEGRAVSPGENLAVDFNETGPRYHELMGIPIVRGRSFDGRDVPGTARVVVVNEAFAREFFGDLDPIGKRISQGPGQPWLEIIGVARDYKVQKLTEPPPPHIDLPSSQSGYGRYASVLLRTSSHPSSLLRPAIQQVNETDPAVTVSDAAVMSEQVRESIAPARMAAALISVFGAVALLLASVGIYGVMAYSVSRRTREIGIRMALGARRRDVLLMVIRRGGLMTTAGLTIGIVCGRAASRLMSSLLYGVGAGDSLAFAGTALLVLSAALFACYLPARRAAKCDPMTALRYE